jgi:hypothetical protein
MAKREKIVLVMQDAANRSKLTFGSWEEAQNHIRMVILGQIVDELAELALQDDPSQFKRTVEDLREIAGDINHPKNEDWLKDAVEAWNDYTHHATGFTTIEIF